MGRVELSGGSNLNFTGAFYSTKIKFFNGDWNFGSLFYCREGMGNFSVVLFTDKINDLARVTNGRTFLSIPDNRFPKLNKIVNISPSSHIINYFYCKF